MPVVTPTTGPPLSWFPTVPEKWEIMGPDLRLDAEPPWQVLLVGGAFGVGKTLATRTPARGLGISHILVDDMRMAIQCVTTPEQQPALFYLRIVLGNPILPHPGLRSSRAARYG